MHNKEIIQLDDSLLYGQGSHKKCFLHPHNKNLCIKIAYNEGGQKDLIREINYIDVLKSIVFYPNILEKLIQI